MRGGRVAVGLPADLAVIDPEALRHYNSEANTHLVWRNELAHHQMVNRSEGVVAATIVGGRIAWRDGHHATRLGREMLGRALLADGREATARAVPMAQAA